MIPWSLNLLQADKDMVDAAADAEDSEQHSSESDLTPSGRLQQQQQVGWGPLIAVYADYSLPAQPAAEKSMEISTCIISRLTSCALVPSLLLQSSSDAGCLPL